MFCTTAGLFGNGELLFINEVLPGLSFDGSLVITQVTAPPDNKRKTLSQKPYHFLRVCSTLFTPFHTFSDGNILYWSAFCFTNCSKSLLLKLLSITSYIFRIRLNADWLPSANRSPVLVFE